MTIHTQRDGDMLCPNSSCTTFAGTPILTKWWLRYAVSHGNAYEAARPFSAKMRRRAHGDYWY